MIFTHLTVTNFRSFKGEQTFYFPSKPGLYFMQGVNASEPRLGTNGAGKTTIWEALLWCLYDKTSKGLKGGSVCNWDVPKGVKVVLHFTTDDGEGHITRTWGPISWKLVSPFGDEEDLTKSKDNPILGIMRLEFAPFLHCILMAQSQPMFLDLKSDQKAAIFSEVMGLDKWIDYSSAASKKASAQDIVTRRLESRIGEIKGRLEGQQDFSGSVSDFEAKRKNKIKEIEQEYEVLLAKSKACIKHESEYRAKVTELKAKIVDAKEVEERAHAKLRNFKDDQDCLELELTEAKRTVRDIKQLIDFFEKHDHCPTCDQDISKRVYDEKVSANRRLLSGAEKKVKRLEDLLATNEKIEGKLIQEESDAAILALDLIYSDIEGYETEATAYKRNADLAERELDRLEDRAEEITKERNPFHDLQKTALDEGKALEQEHRTLLEELDYSMERYSLYSFWVRGFKDLRLQLIAEALTELEIEVNSCVTALGLVDWELKFQVDRETASGTISRGFTVSVISPYNNKPVPWESWSGGESQRLRIAATMGLSNLIRSRTGTELALEVWDEPSTALSQQGVHDLLEALNHRANTEQRPIWIVDHTSHSFGGFAGGATITKRKSGSVIEQY